MLTDGSEIFLDNTKVYHNNSGTSGGGIVVGEETTLTFSSSSITDNTSKLGGGLALNAGQVSGKAYAWKNNTPDDAWVSAQAASYTLEETFTCTVDGCTD